MNASLSNALNASDIDDQLFKSILHAELQIRKFIWNGCFPNASARGTELTVAGMGARDFVTLAVHRLCSGTRTYDESKTFLENVDRTTDSLIWSAKRASDRSPFVELKLETADGLPLDPFASEESSSNSPVEEALKEEILEVQRQCIEQLTRAFDGQRDVQDYLDALAGGLTDIDEISEYAGIP
jgi:hypothetical protein